ncbi:MAG: ABC transporter permease [Thermodesulfatator sp.]|nr:MAG: ABC transporter permease [Thermodesulfatator sp.]
MRLVQFICIFTSGLLVLFAIKYFAGLSDYLIPPPEEIFLLFTTKWADFLLPAINTTLVAIAGHVLAIFLAVIVAFLARTGSRFSSMVKTAAYNLQAYPVVAIAPIVFIFLGDGLASRLLIASLICYFPLLLSFLGIFSDPVVDVEHFFRETKLLTSRMELSIRTFENMDKIITVIAGSGTLAMVGTIVAEFLAATNGIGYVIRKSLYQNNLAAILVSLFFIGLGSSVYLMAVEILGFKIKEKLAG